MTAKLRLPPSERDFDVYVRVTVQQESTRRVATTLRISQTRVCQIVRRVGKYLLSVCPTAISDEDKARQAFLGQQLAAEQLRYFMRQALDAYDRSVGKQTTIREVATSGCPHSTITTTKFSPGDPKYLNLAARFALLGSKLPAPNLVSLMPDQEEDEDESLDRDDQRIDDQRMAAAAVNGPPDGDCSVVDAELVDGPDGDDEDDDASLDEEELSDAETEKNGDDFVTLGAVKCPVQLQRLLMDLGLAQSDLEAFLSSPQGQDVLQMYLSDCGE